MSRPETVNPHWGRGSGDSLDVELVDIGTSDPGGMPEPVVRMYKGEERASLLTPAEARQLAATLLALAARADAM